jgi:hypothetical protein
MPYPFAALRRASVTLLLSLLLAACGASAEPAAGGESAAPSVAVPARPSSASDVATESPAAAAPDQSSSGAPSGEVDWESALQADPRLEIETVAGQLYVMVREAAPPVGGHPLLDDVLYVDMDGDGAAEAAIPLSSGGTAGNVGALIYTMAAGAPQLVAWTDGYKLGLQVVAGRLVVQNAFYAGWEPNCCPSGVGYDTYVLEAGQLKRLEHRDEGFVEAQAPTVEHFYHLINNKELAAAYAMLAPSEQAANPYTTWSAGFASTVEVVATVSADEALSNTVRVELAATDQSGDGGQVVRRYSGTWRLVWDPERAWLLTSPEIAPAP